MARTPIHPGEILADELTEIGPTAKKLAGVIEAKRLGDTENTETYARRAATSPLRVELA